MKKIIAISVMFALFAGAVFAETSLGGVIFTGFTPIMGDTKKDSDPQAAFGTSGRARFTLSAQNDEGTYGAQLWANHWGLGGNYGSAGWVWWKPADIFSIQVGINPNGGDGRGGIAGWGFHGEAQDLGVASDRWQNYHKPAWFPGGGNGFIVHIMPMDALRINAWLLDGNAEKANDKYKKIMFNAVYSVDGVGSFSIGYKGELGKADPDATNSFGQGNVNQDGNLGAASNATPGTGNNIKGFLPPEASTGKVYFDASLSLVEGLGIDIGIGYRLPYKGEEDLGGGEPTSFTYNEPIAVGIGLSYTGDGFGAKLRTTGYVAGSLKGDGYSASLPIMVVPDFVVFYDVADGLRAFLGAGAAYTAESKDFEIKSYTSWWVNPYIRKSLGPGNFFIGVKAESNGLKYNGTDTYVTWGVPVAFTFNF
jgi:hypothetical protein